MTSRGSNFIWHGPNRPVPAFSDFMYLIQVRHVHTSHLRKTDRIVQAARGHLLGDDRIYQWPPLPQTGPFYRPSTQPPAQPSRLGSRLRQPGHVPAIVGTLATGHRPNTGTTKHPCKHAVLPLSHDRKPTYVPRPTAASRPKTTRRHGGLTPASRHY